MDYMQELKFHFKTKSGWVNDPNGLVYFNGYYHIFYQHSPNFETPWNEPMHWGHARTRDFIDWEELPVALYPDRDYDSNGCWSGTAIVREGVLYLFYASIQGEDKRQTVSVAFSTDGIRFEKYDKNPVIDSYPADGGPDFRDPAVCFANGRYYCVMASGNPESKTARLLLYKSDDLFNWEYCGILCQWENCRYAECPSFIPINDKQFLLAASVCPLDRRHYFNIMYGSFEDNKFTIEHSAEVDKGPDQYAGQVFRDQLGRNILISWIPGWSYTGYAQRDVGCMSVPREITLKNGKITAFPVKELWHLLKDSDDAVTVTDDSFKIERQNREPVIYNGKINDLKILRDGFIIEVFVNGGEEVYSALL